MSRSLSLGLEGEEQWGYLWRTLMAESLGSVFGVLSPHPRARDEARRRLSEECPKLIALAPGPSVWEALATLQALPPREDGVVPVLWVEAEEGTDLYETWLFTLRGMNIGRDGLFREGGVLIVLAGPPELHLLTVRTAPDLFSVIGMWAHFDTAPEALVPATSPFDFLHLSDLHIKGGNWEQDLVLSALRRDLPKLLTEAGLQPAMVFVTGDIANWGQEKEYDVAHRFLHGLMGDLSLDPRMRLFVVPGNHDVDRKQIFASVSRGQKALLSEEDRQSFKETIAEIQSNPEDLASFGRRQLAFCQFTSRLQGAARGLSVDRPYRTDVLALPDEQGLAVGIASLNSAWLCGPDEDKKGRIVLGERQLRDALDEIQSCNLRIVLAHHPLDWLHESEARSIRELLASRAHLFLHGHVHEADLLTEQRGGSGLVVMGAGGAYTGSRWFHSVQVGRIDPGKGELRLRCLRYSDRDGGFWHVDESVSRQAKGGWLSARLSLEGVETRSAAFSPEALAARLAAAAGRLSDQTRFIGLPMESGRHPRSALRDLFVAPELGLAGGQEAEPLATLETALFGPGPARFVVIGEPGAGKSTLLHHLVLQAEAQRPPLAPLRLELREWLRQGGTEPLLRFAARFAAERLSVPVGEAELGQLAEEGRLLLLIDGMDEVAEESQRARVRDDIVALAHAHPKLRLLCTSRPAGYDRAPLPRDFGERHLRAFTDPQLDDFVGRWMTVTEADPVRREERRLDLLSAFSAEPRVREMARVPLLATLIAMVHERHAKLPGQRAELYHLVVELLLDTWPGAKGQEFRELDVGRQRELLKRLALSMQEARTGHYNEAITLSRSALRAKLTDLLLERDLQGRSRDEAERVAGRFINWLTARTGLLIEQQPGVYGFLHLSVLEFLAGRALLDREMAKGVEAVGKVVVDLHRKERWQETLLLMLGKEANRIELVRQVARAVAEATALGKDGWETAVFGLRLVREELDVGEALREALLMGVVDRLVNVRQFQWEEPKNTLADVLRFGHLHGAAVRAWIEMQWVQGEKERIQGLLALLPELSETPASLPLRPLDVQLAVLDFFPSHPVARSCFASAESRTLLRWTGDTPLEIGTWYLLNLIGVTQYTATGSLAAVRRIGKIAGLLCLKETQSSSSLALVCCRRGTKTAKTRSYVLASTTPPGTASPDFAADFVVDFAVDLVSDLDAEFAFDFSVDVSKLFARYYKECFQRVPDIALPTDIAIDLAKDFIDALARNFDLDFGNDFMEFLTKSRVPLQICWIGTNELVAPLGLSGSPNPWLDLQGATASEEVMEATNDLNLSFAAEAIAGLLPLVGRTNDPAARNEAALLATLRVQNHWLFLYFEPFVEHARSLHGGTLPPEVQALLIALGLSQAQTTWQWPWGPTWAAWFAPEAAPPEHWLAAFWWWQVKAVASTTPEELTAAHAAAREALSRTDWPELAEALSPHLCYPHWAPLPEA